LLIQAFQQMLRLKSVELKQYEWLVFHQCCLCKHA